MIFLYNICIYLNQIHKQIYYNYCIYKEIDEINISNKNEKIKKNDDYENDYEFNFVIIDEIDR